jgi:hypothetical protein
MDDRFKVSAGAGILRAAGDAVMRFPHQWTSNGVTVDAAFTGGHLLHLAAAGCVLNDVYWEGTGPPRNGRPVCARCSLSRTRGS